MSLCHDKHTFKLCGTTTIGTKGQVVIPKEARDMLGIGSGDSVSFIVKDKDLIGIVPNSSIEEMIEKLSKEKNFTFIS